MVPDLRPGHRISIHALREESDRRFARPAVRRRISIHALREESDTAQPDRTRGHQISIHALREESDNWARTACTVWRHFNPRSP